MEQVEAPVEEGFRQVDKVWGERMAAQGNASSETIDNEKDDEQPYRNSPPQAAQRRWHQNG